MIMKWYEIQNKRTKIVSEFIKLFIITDHGNV